MRHLFFGTRFLAAIIATSGLSIRADEPSKSDSPAGFKDLSIGYQGKKLPVRVMDVSPYKNVKSDVPADGKYHPELFSFNTTSPMANKTFDTSTAMLVRPDPDFTNPEKSTFVSKGYSGANTTAGIPGLDTKNHDATPFLYGNNVDTFNKTYSTGKLDAELTRSAILPSEGTKDIQNHAAVLGGLDQSKLVGENAMSHKQYLGPGAQHVPDDINIKENVVISRMSDIPNRDLTIDEVRNLINHGTKPDTAARPDEPTKPLNDPDYKPTPLRGTPNPGAETAMPPAPADKDDDKNDAVPPPGTMGSATPPENSEPLPKH